MLYYIVKYGLKWLLWLIHRPKIYGKKENLKLEGGVIFICNHQNLLDPVMMLLTSPRVIHFMAKKELFDNKLLGALMRSAFVFPVNRRTADIKALKQALALLEEGHAFGIFPEGTRSVTGEMDEFEKGCAFIAAKTSAPIVPLYISPSSYKFGRRLRLIVGECIYASEVKDALPEGAKLVDALNSRMEGDMHALKAELERQTGIRLMALPEKAGAGR